MSHLSPQDPADRPPVGRMGISRDALRLALGHLDESLEETPGSMLVPVRAAQGVEEHPLAVAGALARAPAPGDVHGGLVQVPGAAGVATPQPSTSSSPMRHTVAPGPVSSDFATVTCPRLLYQGLS